MKKLIIDWWTGLRAGWREVTGYGPVILIVAAGVVLVLASVRPGGDPCGH